MVGMSVVLLGMEKALGLRLVVDRQAARRTSYSWARTSSSSSVPCAAMVRKRCAISALYGLRLDETEERLTMRDGECDAPASCVLEERR